MENSPYLSQENVNLWFSTKYLLKKQKKVYLNECAFVTFRAGSQTLNYVVLLQLEGGNPASVILLNVSYSNTYKVVFVPKNVTI